MIKVFLELGSEVVLGLGVDFLNNCETFHRFIRNKYVNRKVTATYNSKVNKDNVRETKRPHTLNTMNVQKIHTSLHLCEYLMLNVRSKNSSAVLNGQNLQAVVESGLIR